MNHNNEINLNGAKINNFFISLTTNEIMVELIDTEGETAVFTEPIIKSRYFTSILNPDVNKAIVTFYSLCKELDAISQVSSILHSFMKRFVIYSHNVFSQSFLQSLLKLKISEKRKESNADKTGVNKNERVP